MSDKVQSVPITATSALVCIPFSANPSPYLDFVI